MFRRRHPYLFFILSFAAISGTVVIAILLMIITLTTGWSGLVEFKKGGEKVGIIEINGVIVESDNIIARIKKFREDNSIKAIVIRINSPGGGVGPSQEIFSEIRRTVKVKKVIASMGAVAASGGYYVAAGADKIVANPGTITGSIGVIMEFTNYKELMDKIGLVPVVIKSCRYKDIGSPARDMTENERKFLNDFVRKIHSQFVMAISEGRNMDSAKVKEIADGRIFSGEDALKAGFVDRLGNLEDAVNWAGELAGIKGKITTVTARESRLPLLKYVEESCADILTKYGIFSYPYPAYIYRPSE